MQDKEIQIGSKWQHFKGSIIEVINIAKNSETLEDMVIYKHDDKLWVRPISLFLSSEDITTRSDNVTGQKYRFERIDENDRY